jgi:hypothetical protein
LATVFDWSMFDAAAGVDTERNAAASRASQAVQPHLSLCHFSLYLASRRSLAVCAKKKHCAAPK